MKKERKKEGFKELIPYIVILLVVILIKQFLFTTILVDGKSMEKTLYNNDLMILNKIGIKLKPIKRFDIIVIKNGKNKLIKRVIALPGETVEYRDNKLYINDELVEENYGSDVTYDFDAVKVPEDNYFVLGDNRTDSADSRLIGTIPKKEILGHAVFTVYPFNRFGSK